MEALLTASNITSLGLTVTQAALSIMVIQEYGPSAWDSVVRWWRGRSLLDRDWLMIGIVLGFIFDTGDAGYWFMPWTANYYGHHWADELFAFGSVPNVLFRHLGTIAAATCHLIGAYGSDSARFRRNMLRAWLGGLGFSAFVVLTGNY